MLREAAVRHGHAHEPGFEWRGREVSRLEGLSDAVFAFAITLLVISLEVPRDVHEMVLAMRGFIGFVFSFFLLYRLWVTQYRYFRRYGLEDSTTVGLNGVLLFMVLFFVYPLKFLANAITTWGFEHGLRELRPRYVEATLGTSDGRALVLCYFWGSAAVLGTLGLMYRHAYRLRHPLRLTPHEAHRTRATYQRLFLSALLGLVTPFGVLSAASPDLRLQMAGAISEYTALAVLGLFALRLRRSGRRTPAMHEPYVEPDVEPVDDERSPEPAARAPVTP